MTSRSRSAVRLLVLCAFAAGCGATGETMPAPSLASIAVPSPEPSAPSVAPSVEPSPTSRPTESLTEELPRDRFSDPTTIDNPWFTLQPGTRWTWEGEVDVDGRRVPHSVVFTVTDLTKTIEGITTVVAYDEDYTDGLLVEAEIVFYAQDDDGIVWHFGQYPEEYELGEFVAAPTWISGIHDATAGISMKTDPQPSDPSYSQGWGPEVGWTDRAKVFEVGSRTCVPVGCYDDVLVIDEFNRDEPDAHQLKYFARGVGNVRVGWAGALEQEREVLELISVEQLDPEAIAAVRATALAIEGRAYDFSPEVYGQTDPMRVP